MFNEVMEKTKLKFETWKIESGKQKRESIAKYNIFGNNERQLPTAVLHNGLGLVFS